MAIAAKNKSKRPAHAKKRQAQHHRQSKHYLKAYWPYLPMLMIVGVGLAINSLWASSNAVLGAKADYSSSVLLDQTNAARVQQNETPLTINSQLAAAAQAKASDMAHYNYWAHDSPQGKTPWSFIAASGYQFQAAGENLAYGFENANDTITGWMNSNEHRANIMNAQYQNVGFGVAQATSYQGKGPQTIIVAEYGQPVGAVGTFTFSVPKHGDVQGVTKSNALAAKPVSRIQLLTGGQAAWSYAAISAIGGAAFALFLVRHGLRLQRLVLQGEAFVAHHPLLDIAVVSVFTTGFVLTRASGIIR